MTLRFPRPAALRSFARGTSSSSSRADGGGDGVHRRRRRRALPTRSQQKSDPRTRTRVGIALLVAAFILGMGGLIYMTGRVEPLEEEKAATQERLDGTQQQLDGVAKDLQEDATTITALCATGSDVARALEAAGQCGRAAERLANPVVASVAPTLTQDQINSIVQRVLALTPPPTSVDTVVDAVLARMASDPALRGLTESEVRSIVAAAIAALPEPERGPEGPEGPQGPAGGPGAPGVSFGGLQFVRSGGECVAVVTFIEPDGNVRTEETPVSDSACEPVAPPTTDPPPPPTTTPPPPPTTDPPVTSDPPAPSVESPPSTGDGGLLGG